MQHREFNWVFCWEPLREAWRTSHKKGAAAGVLQSFVELQCCQKLLWTTLWTLLQELEGVKKWLLELLPSSSCPLRNLLRTFCPPSSSLTIVDRIDCLTGFFFGLFSTIVNEIQFIKKFLTYIFNNSVLLFFFFNHDRYWLKVFPILIKNASLSTVTNSRLRLHFKHFWCCSSADPSLLVCL